jgi:hypothetical protein
MPYSHYDLATLKACLERAKLAGFLYQHDSSMLVLQEAFNDDGSALNNFIQHEHSTDQLGVQFALQLSEHSIDFLIGITHSNQDRSYEIGAGNLKGEQKAFNLLYAFYNYPKAMYVIRMPLASTSAQLENALEEQLMHLPQLSFLNSAIKTNPLGEKVFWMKSFLIQQSLEMKVRIQTALH